MACPCAYSDLGRSSKHLGTRDRAFARTAATTTTATASTCFIPITTHYTGAGTTTSVPPRR